MGGNKHDKLLITKWIVSMRNFKKKGGGKRGKNELASFLDSSFLQEDQRDL